VFEGEVGEGTCLVYVDEDEAQNCQKEIAETEDVFRSNRVLFFYVCDRSVPARVTHSVENHEHDSNHGAFRRACGLGNGGGNL